MAVITPDIPGYTIKKQLGRGGMATVFLATQEQLNREVALKVMSNQLGDDSIWAKRFIQEAQVIAQLTHPNVIPVFDVGTHGGQFFIAMEYLAGGSLKGRVAKGIAISEVLKIVVGVAAGLDFAGEKGFVHRDIKPDNIMFRADGSPVILDFGIVKQMDSGASGMTQTGVIVGTTSYMSPEQAQGRELDQRSDIYALGIMFYELLTGKPPFKGETDVGTLLMHISEPVPRLPSNLSVFQPVIDKALAKDSFHRYTRAREMIDHLQELEPKIKAALSNMKVGIASDPTLVSNKASRATSNDPDATLVMGNESATGQTTAVTSEEELTKVLSSARATIRDFSAEARAQKARRTKNLILSISLLAGCAVAYVGYQQLILVPQERAVAAEKLRAAEQRTQNKIKELLTEAKSARAGLVPSESDSVDNVIALYREVLKLDPENNEATFMLEKFGERYIEMAKNAVRRRDFTKAITYRDYAEQLAPTSPELEELRSAVKALRGEEIDREFVKEEVDNLISLAQGEIMRSSTFSDSAYTRLQQALRLNPNNEKASGLVAKMLADLYDQTEKDIVRGRLDRAQDNLVNLKNYYDDVERVKALELQFREKTNQLAKEDNVANLLKKAERMEREKRSLSTNDQLRDIYMAILKIEDDNLVAIRGISEVTAFDAKLTRAAIKERDYARAQKQIDTIARYTKQSGEVKNLVAELKQAKDANAKASALLAEAQNLIQQNQAPQDKRETLLSAFKTIENAKSLDETNPAVGDTLKRLESEYVSTISKLITAENQELVSAYFSDTADKRWPSDRLLQLQLTQQQNEKKTKPKRVVTGGF